MCIAKYMVCLLTFLWRYKAIVSVSFKESLCSLFTKKVLEFQGIYKKIKIPIRNSLQEIIPLFLSW